MTGEVIIAAERAVDDQDLMILYGSAGWTAYTADPDVFRRAIANSSHVVTAISDDATICYLQDVLVHPG
ncbi:hypothetical protein [Microlunatus parietis]|uniref:Uncharacterized protein n=1 Tax=Microlunatus parietis TaxID=682979 RepID=A0A7Y9IFJ4_9ACTN|nr:hypothetical protein [Microlunatus parietis]NYE75289.1 hypothetical protein [Microlunatus parietis]